MTEEQKIQQVTLKQLNRKGVTIQWNGPDGTLRHMRGTEKTSFEKADKARRETKRRRAQKKRGKK